MAHYKDFPFQFGPGHCCCDCPEFTDEFSRADSTDLGDDWEECVGDWEIYRDTLTCPDDDAIVSLVPMFGWPVGIIWAEVLIFDVTRGISSVGGKAMIYAYMGSDGTPCIPSGTGGLYKLELEILTTTTGTLRFWDGGDLIGQRDCFFNGPTTWIWMCISNDPALTDNQIEGGCSDQALMPIWTCWTNIPDYYFALGNDNAEHPVFYESCHYIDHYDHDPTCPDCSLNCCCPCIEAENLRPDLTATISGDCLGTMAGASATLTCGGIAGECCIWSTSEYGPLSFTCQDGVDIHTLGVSMECMGNACDDYELTVWWPGNNGGNAACCLQSDMPATKGVVGVCHCEPLNITFGPFRLWRDPSMLDQYCCLCCEEFYIVVTL